MLTASRTVKALCASSRSILPLGVSENKGVMETTARNSIGRFESTKRLNLFLAVATPLKTARNLFLAVVSPLKAEVTQFVLKPCAKVNVKN